MANFPKIYSSYPRNELCPCDSGKKAKHCCLSSGDWNKLPMDITPPAPKTNYANIKCYSSFTEDCDSKITKEHYISNAVLRQINEGTKKINIEGTSWLEDKVKKTVSTSSLVSTNLCKRHNESLSPLDKEASRLFKVLDSFNEAFLEPNPTEEIRVFSGEDLERWLFKTAIGILVSGQLRNDGKPLKLKTNSDIIQLLYGQVKWPKNCGLFMLDQKSKYLSSVGCTAITDKKQNKLLGMKFWINNFVFNLAFIPREDHRTLFGIHRPKTLVFSNGKISKCIEFCWQDKTNQNVMDLLLLNK